MKKAQMPTVTQHIAHRSLTNAPVLAKLRFAPLSLEFASADCAIINNSRGGGPIDKFLQQCSASIRSNPNPPLLQMAQCKNQTHGWTNSLRMWKTCYLDSAAELLYGFSLPKPLTLVKDFSAAFCQVDPTVLRALVQSVRIPPPGCVPPALPHPPPVPAVVDPELPTFPFACILPDGTSCTFIGKDAKRLETHMQKFPSTLSPQARAKVTNVCPWCSRTFSEISSARHHIKTTQDRGHCGKPRSSFTIGTVNPPSSLVCPTCSIVSTSVSALLECVRSHFSHVFRTDLAPRLHRFRSVFVGAWALGAPPSQVARLRRMSEQKADADTEQLSRLVRVVAKLCLKNSLEIRELQAATLVTYVVPKPKENEYRRPWTQPRRQQDHC